MTSLPARLALALVSGLLAAVSFEPFDWPYLLPLAGAGLTLAVLGTTPGRASATSWRSLRVLGYMSL